ncbi:hypothetical protein N7467_002444 [Penicillium canescens]|nr:hypothetical protein N7467_002444 [Penicillium canescens]
MGVEMKSDCATDLPHTNGSSGTLPERSPQTGISVLVVGGGVAGLLAALECWRKGHDVRILEKSLSRALSGDALTIGTSAVRALKKWPDMAEENDRISYEMWISWHKINGDLISGPAPFRPNTDKNDSTGGRDAEPPATIYRHSRPTMHKMLADQVERGLTVEYGKQVVEYHEDPQSPKAYVILENKEKIEGRGVRARPTGYSIYRALLPIDQVLLDPIIDEKFPLLKTGISSTIMDGNRGSSSESWSNWAGPEVVLQTTATIPGWPEFANRLIKATTKDQIHDFKLVWREPQPCWISPGGRVVQFGDAAHSFLPSSGNGATQGMEDAVSLATCLQIAGKENVPWAICVHNKLTLTKPIGILGSWIWKHDPEQYAIENYEKALAHLKSGSEFRNTNIPPGHVCRPRTIDEFLKAREAGKEIVLDGDWD